MHKEGGWLGIYIYVAQTFTRSFLLLERASYKSRVNDGKTQTKRERERDTVLPALILDRLVVLKLSGALESANFP